MNIPSSSTASSAQNTGLPASDPNMSAHGADRSASPPPSSQSPHRTSVGAANARHRVLRNISPMPEDAGNQGEGEGVKRKRTSSELSDVGAIKRIREDNMRSPSLGRFGALPPEITMKISSELDALQFFSLANASRSLHELLAGTTEYEGMKQCRDEIKSLRQDIANLTSLQAVGGILTRITALNANPIAPQDEAQRLLMNVASTIHMLPGSFQQQMPQELIAAATHACDVIIELVPSGNRQLFYAPLYNNVMPFVNTMPQLVSLLQKMGTNE